MNQEFKDCLEQQKIIKDANAKRLVPREIEAAEKDLAVAQKSFREGQFKWTTIQSYYSSFHAARALLFSQGYRERSHYCLIQAIEALFVDTGKVDVRLLRFLINAKVLREKADYELEFSKDGAEKALEIAKTFLEKVKSLLL